jgi:Mg2+/citrate symporter
VSPELRNKVVRCTRKQLGVDDAAASLATIAGHNGIATAGKFGGAVKGTSVASIVARSALSWVPDSKIRLPTITGGLLSGRPQKVIFVKSVGAFVGRAIPVVGTAYLAYDIGSVVYCSVK